MPRWGGLLGLALVGCLETPDIELVDPDQRVADAQGPDGADQAATPVDGGPDAMRPDAAPAGDKGVDGGGCVPQAERCDGLDDDCDGVADEGLSLGEACTVGLGECERRGVYVCAPGGEVGCSAVAGAAADEACNLRDDDCDGTVDEAVPSVACAARDCAAGVTICQAGAVQCVPDPELLEDCGAAGDDDCDGAVDEGCECAVGAERPCGNDEGQCAAGLQTCAGGGWGPCVGATGPQAEACNGLDDDCDGQSDEGLAGAPCEAAGAVGACRAGALACVDGNPRCLEAAPRAEACDGTDEDCDGRVDEAFGVGDPCTVGRGLCLRNGRLVCTGPNAASCNVAPGAPREEACNQADDDCDGRVDEAFPVGQACEVGEGACRSAGIWVCAPGGVRCNAPEPGAGAVEICDGLDNDCDGAMDEGVLATACFAGVGACRRQGLTTCMGGAPGCTAQPGPASAETCDGLDNDCDGRTDEGLDDAFCPTGGQGLCAQGVTRCQGGVLSCLAPAPRPERCDGLDNDCDGQVDDSLPAALCDTGLPGICAQGAETCAGGQIECEPVAAPTLERCDGEDNDCDGAVDEASNRLMCPRVFPNTTAACVAGACEFSCIEGYVDADGVPGCERGCSFDPPVGIGLLPEATSVAVALDPEGAVGMLALYPDGAFFQVLGGAPLNLDVRGAANGRLLSPAPGLWVAAVARLEANGALSDGVDLFRLDGGPMPLETRRLNTQALRTGLVGFTERAGGGDGAVFMAGVVGGRDSVLHLRGSPLSLPQVPSYRQIGGLETVSQLAAAPVDGRAWTFAWDNTEDSLLVTLADGQGLGPPLVSPHLRGDATRSDAVMTPEGATLAMADRQGRLAFSRFTPEGGAFTAPIGPVLPPLDDFALVAPQDSGLWLIGRPLGSQRCQLWPLNTNLGSGAAIDLPVPACTDVAVAHGPEPQQVVILALGPGGDVSLVTGTCE